MKNWIIALLIFIVPISFYAYFEAKAQNAMMCAAPSKLNSDKVKIIKFSSPMCSECKQAGAELDKVMKDHKEGVIIEEINVTENTGKEGQYTKDAIKKYKVTLVPTLVFLNKDGKMLLRHEGAMKSKDIIEVLDGNK